MDFPNCLRSSAYLQANSHAPAGQANHLSANADAALIQGFDRDLVALAGLAQHVFLGHAAIFQNQLARGRRPDAQLVFLLPDGESREILFNQECGNPLVAGRGIKRGEENKESSFLAVGDPELAAVQDVLEPLSAARVCSANASEPEPASLRA